MHACAKKLKLIKGDTYCNEEIQGSDYNQAHRAVMIVIEVFPES